MWSDDGIVIRLPESVDGLPEDELLIDPDEIEELIVSQLPGTAMFASRFRECAARALLLPKRRPDRRTPLWQQRQRSADLLSVAGRYPSFPILLEATRECLNDVFDVPALAEVLRDLRARRIRLVSVDVQQASPFAQSLMFGWIAVYMYAGDAPLAERRAAALALDRDLLRDLLGAEELRELIDADVLADLELELQRLVEGRLARDVDEAHDQLRLLGPLSLDELGLRSVDGAPVKEWVDQLVTERRAFLARIAARGARVRGRGRRPAARRPRRRRARRSPGCLHRLRPDAGRRPGRPVRRAPTARSSCSTPPAATAWAPTRCDRRWRCSSATAGWCGASSAPTASSGSGATATCSGSCGAGRSPRCARRWSRSTPARSPASCRAGTASASPAGAWTRWSTWSRSSRAPRWWPRRSTATSSASGSRSTSPADLDALCTSGDVVWVGAGAIGSTDGRIRLAFRDQAGLLLPAGGGLRTRAAAHRAARPTSTQRGASFWTDLTARRAAGGPALRRPDRAGRALGPRVGRPRHERLARPAARLRGHHRAALGGSLHARVPERVVAHDRAG